MNDDQFTVVPNSEAFDDLLEAEAPLYEVKFASEAEETAYEQTDTKLIEVINSAVQTFNFREDNFYQIEDWWPNHLRGIELGIAALSMSLIDRLQLCLCGEFQRWRIICQVYDHLLTDGPSDYAGSLLIRENEVVITQDLVVQLSNDDRAPEASNTGPGR